MNFLMFFDQENGYLIYEVQYNVKKMGKKGEEKGREEREEKKSVIIILSCTSFILYSFTLPS